MNPAEPSPPPDRKKPVHFAAEERRNRAVLYFVTVCTKDRRPVLANDDAHRGLVSAWELATWFAVGRYVVMPDHVHFFYAPATFPAEAFVKWMGFWKSSMARNWPGGGGKLWQRDFWDRQIRAGESYTEKWEYVRNNPVRAGLVATAEEWKYQGEMNILRWHE